MEQTLSRYFKISSEVQSALDNNLPIVALESTIITHGMPYPENYKTAKSVENTIRKLNVTPATIAIINGIIHIGLTDSQILNLSQMDNKYIYKCTRRTLPYVLTNKLNGSTTVAATMYIAYLAKISIFVTGGIGGVHRGVQQTMDISADLIELSQTPVTVICAGIKSILDIPKTLEYLETHGVTVTTLKQDNFPAFFMSDSKIKSPLKSENISQIANMIKTSRDLKLNNGILVGVPNNFDKSDDFEKLIENATNIALREIKEKNITGRDITPYILDRVHGLTKGKSLNANIKLIHNNAKIGAQIALKLYENSNNDNNHNNNTSNNNNLSEVLVIGGCVNDIIGSPNKSSEKLIAHTSNPGHAQFIYGGTGRNIAECIAKLDHSVTMLSAIGDDVIGNKMANYMESVGINMSNIIRSKKYPSSSYIAIFDKNNDLFVSIADLTVLEKEMNDDYFNKMEIKNLIKSSKFIVLDGNLKYDMMETITSFIDINNNKIQIWYEPISVEKCQRIIDKSTHRILPGITYISPNEMELFALLKATKYPNRIKEKKNSNTINDYVTYCKYIISKGVKNISLTLGSNGVLIVMDNGEYQHIKVKKISASNIKNTNGAGDNLCGATICGLLEGKSLIEAVKYGINASRMCLDSKHAVNPKLSRRNLIKIMRSNL